MNLNLHLGSDGKAEERRAMLADLADEVQAIGYRGHPSISEMLSRIADAAEFDFDQAAKYIGELMTLAAQSYVVASEEAAQTAAEADNWLRNGAYRTQSAAKHAAGSEPAIVVKFTDGSYDWFPVGAPVASVHDGRVTEYAVDQYQVVARRLPERGWVATNR